MEKLTYIYEFAHYYFLRKSLWGLKDTYLDVVKIEDLEVGRNRKGVSSFLSHPSSLAWQNFLSAQY